MDDLDLYGGTHPWDSSLWQTTDDRVRGGASHSYLYVVNPELARFYGTLDISTLGGAGFASQQSYGEQHWDLSGGYDGIVLSVAASDGKRYTLTLKDQLPGHRGDGRQKSGLSYEADFIVPRDATGKREVFIPWKDLKPTYRGREKPDAEPLNLKSVKRISLMMRSYFGKQEGDFSLDIHSIAARKRGENDTSVMEAGAHAKHRDGDEEEEEDEVYRLKASVPPKKTPGWRRMFCGLL